MIPQDFIDEVLSRTDLVELIRSRVDLKRAGRDWKACCPFHNEKTPSFHVVPQKQFYHCFGCGAHGNALGFLMDFDRLEFRAAVELLAHQVGMELPQEQQGQHNQHGRLYEVLDKAQQHFRIALKGNDLANSYLRKRGINEDMIRQYEIGLAPPGWQFLTEHLSHALKDAEEAGLIARKEDRHYDRFRNRITFPIRDLRGRIVGFGGRTLDDDPAKYLNSPESPVFHKGRIVYGLYEARQALREIDYILIVEGYMDVIALAQFGIHSAVATLGTATTAEHLQLLLRNCRKLIFCFDGDEAGRRAADRALHIALANMQDGCNMRFMFLPQGHDPDSLIREEGQAGFEQRLHQASPLSARLLELLKADLDLDSAEGKAALLSEAQSQLKNVKAPAFRDFLLEEIQKLTGTKSGTVQSVLGPTPAREATSRRQIQAPQRMTPLRRAIALLLTYPRCADKVDDVEGIGQASIPGCSLLAELLDKLHSQPNLHCAALIQSYQGRPEADILEKLSLVELETDEDAAILEFHSICQQLIKAGQESEFESLQKALAQGQLDEASKQRYKQLVQQMRTSSKI